MYDKIKLSIGGAGESTWFPIKCITHEQLIKWIEEKDLPKKTTLGLIKLAKACPNNALGTFKKNFNIHLEKIERGNNGNN